MANDATQCQVEASKEQHKIKLQLFKEQRFVERIPKSKFINAFDETNLIDIKEEHIGYNNRSIPDTFAHLYKSYGKVTDTDIISNKGTMHKYQDPDTPM